MKVQNENEKKNRFKKEEKQKKKVTRLICLIQSSMRLSFGGVGGQWSVVSRVDLVDSFVKADRLDPFWPLRTAQYGE